MTTHQTQLIGRGCQLGVNGGNRFQTPAEMFSQVVASTD
jgi:hypothetical protein